jgi:hypothetical protein
VGLIIFEFDSEFFEINKLYAQGPAKSKKLKKNLLTFQSPPPPSEVETTVIIESERIPGKTLTLNQKIDSSRLHSVKDSKHLKTQLRKPSLSDEAPIQEKAQLNLIGSGKSIGSIFEMATDQIQLFQMCRTLL